MLLKELKHRSGCPMVSVGSANGVDKKDAKEYMMVTIRSICLGNVDCNQGLPEITSRAL